MKKINHFNKIVLSLIVVLLAGCGKSFTDLTPISNANTNNFYNSEADFESAITAAMNTLYSVYAPEGPVSYTGELMSDNATLYLIAGAQADKYAIRDYTIQTANTMVYSFWRTFYSALFNVNTVLDKLQEATQLDVEYKKIAEAEMRFLRGVYYFYMVRMWGGMPLVTKAVSAQESYGILRSTETEVYEQIKTDLQFAMENLPLATNVKLVGRPTKGAAQTALGEVYLTLGDKTAAAETLLEVYNSGQYALLPTFAEVWGPDAKNTKESVFEIQYSSANASTGTHSPFYQFFFPNINLSGFSGVGMNQVTDDLYNEYETGDPRRDITVAQGYQSGATFVEQKFYQKWIHPDATVNGTTLLANNDFMVYRFADVLLMLTEATGDPQYMNEVRDRADLPLWGTTAYPTDKYGTLPLALEHEARMELAGEFKRWFLLKRQNRAVSVLTAKGKSVTEEKLLLPIPDIVRLQNNLITQNDGY
ncbi:RagB/SusD family nutrient uptake outer membrane protein [Sphingobacterium sp. DN00404]|uniref:RagB/SusD family nutrient uptake outer membrane protein n=1 Tax=Sphingobacterium micropteri TaxID=2763501 RepID=A0ABR7YQU7_9SPHI|nr:RagB/SusD family nutrient uptake outer membrane protein [Sphingobacterium micropteri]MBD1433715.1 RagB/SusD family nutrient uptake outer membrane protein [Sphingobacterium micropteri]